MTARTRTCLIIAAAFLSGVFSLLADDGTTTIIATPSVGDSVNSLMAAASRFSVAGVMAVGIYFLAKFMGRIYDELKTVRDRYETESLKVIEGVAKALEANTDLLRRVERLLGEDRRQT